MCGIVSIKYKSENPDIGKEATLLLKRLEYRGYDSTGAAFIGADGKIVVRKKVGSPTKVTKELKIDSFQAERFIGQVRWATFGAVTDVNSQPHHVNCKVEMVGAHNGNITNTDTLKEYLTQNGHKVLSDNDGEIIVHMIEHFYAEALEKSESALNQVKKAFERAGIEGKLCDRTALLVDAIRKAEAKAIGSYAAACTDPKIEGIFAIKSGSSLYAGKGSDERGDFIVISSDLTSVLAKTRMLIPLSEGEGIYFTHDDYFIFTLSGELSFSKPKLKRSKLNVRDTALSKEFKYFMDQEIHSSPENIDTILRYYFKDAEAEALEAVFEEKRDIAKEVMQAFLRFYDEADESALAQGFKNLTEGAEFRELVSRLQRDTENLGFFKSAEASFVSDEKELLSTIYNTNRALSSDLKIIDALFVWKRRRSVTRYYRELVQAMQEARKNSGRVFFLASGTSFHASLIGAYFFNSLSDISIFPLTPGQFYSLYLNSLKDGDLIVGITQSGETKDLVDVLIAAEKKCKSVKRIAIVNNENSRIPQELSDFFLPILCGPEIAVAATKSFISQLAILYILAASATMSEKKIYSELKAVKESIEETLEYTKKETKSMAEKLSLTPSMHILGTGLLGLAKEGSLKIREVVLNHTEGYDAQEFKHGPNTILGKNTIFGAKSLTEAVKNAQKPHESLEDSFTNYPLVFVSPPNEHDTCITISQVHTHKIRGADILMIAEENPELRKAVMGRPEGDKKYDARYIALPKHGDTIKFVFSSAIVLQKLAFEMSEIKMKYLDSIGIEDHGVHPDAPKNVSKSITVD